jgi:hypothetical protein
MAFVFLALIALVGATIESRRRREDRLAVDVYLVWWLVAVVGVSDIVGALAHLFDGADVAENIGYTRGDGGFQYENAMGDLAIGIAGVLAFRFRGYFWLVLILITSIQYYGDAGGHIYFWLAEDNTKPDNVGFPLVADLVAPTFAIILYAVSWSKGGDARPRDLRPVASTSD